MLVQFKGNFYICYLIILPYANLLILHRKQKSKREIRLIPQSTILKPFVHPCIRQLNPLHPKIKEYKIGRPPSLFANPVWTLMYFYLIQYIKDIGGLPKIFQIHCWVSQQAGTRGVEIRIFDGFCCLGLVFTENPSRFETIFLTLSVRFYYFFPSMRLSKEMDFLLKKSNKMKKITWQTVLDVKKRVLQYTSYVES